MAAYAPLGAKEPSFIHGAIYDDMSLEQREDCDIGVAAGDLVVSYDKKGFRIIRKSVKPYLVFVALQVAGITVAALLAY